MKEHHEVGWRNTMTPCPICGMMCQDETDLQAHLAAAFGHPTPPGPVRVLRDGVRVDYKDKGDSQ
jgi:hypothetical protein